MMVFALLSLVIGGALLALWVLRWRDETADRKEWARLRAKQAADPLRYDARMVADLPVPAQRFFNYCIMPGTPLLTVAEIEMGGEFSLGPPTSPKYQRMQARQILAAPHGFVWQLRLPGSIPVTGSDSAHWTRFRLFGLLPVARQGGDPDHARSAFGRYIAEALFWTPAAVLPGPNVVWESIDEHTARVTVQHAGLSQSVELSVRDDGRPSEVRFMRWSNANPEKKHQLQPFGGVLSDFREVQGFRVPFSVEAGNQFGTDAYFPFFKAKVLSLRFPLHPN